MKLGIGIDTGGTYTDAVIYDFDINKVLAKGKTLTTKANLECCIENALDLLPDELVRRADVLALSTTLATNACVENKGGRAKLILLGTTRKVLEWINAEKVYGLKYGDVLCIDTKCSADGRIVDNPDWDAVTADENDWFSDAEALSVAEVNAPQNGAACEKLAKEKLTAKYDVPFVMAHELVNDLNVMERGATALLNAKLLPTVDDFLDAIEAVLQKKRLDVRTMIVRSDGSLMSKKTALAQPVKTILSGPAASVIGGRRLTDCQNSLIVDIGGTTTDISIVKDGVPAMTDTVRIGGYKTQIRGVYIDTFGLGGDSRITAADNRLVLNSRRVMPLCAAAERFPCVKGELQRLIELGKVNSNPLYEFLYLVREPSDLSKYDAYEAALIEKLREHPVMLGGGDIDIHRLKCDRLEDEGVVMRCGLTPTDIMHIRGDYCRFDGSVSVLAARYMLRLLPGYSDTADDLDRFCGDVYDMICRKLYCNIVRVMLTNKYPKLFEKGMSEQIMTLIGDSCGKRESREFFSLKFDTAASLIGIGAPTHIFLPTVARALGTDCIIPEHAEVANAVGAVTADVAARAVVTVAPQYAAEGIGVYAVYAAGESRTFDNVDSAVDYARHAAETAAVADARQRGAIGELNVDIEVASRNGYSKEGTAIDLGTTVTAAASGRI